MASAAELKDATARVATEQRQYDAAVTKHYSADRVERARIELQKARDALAALQGKPVVTPPATPPAPGPAAPLPTPTPSGGTASTTLPKVFVTMYSRGDNTPPGSAAISHPQVHKVAGGTGTYADPWTMATGWDDRDGHLQFAAGTRFYLPYLQGYGIVEDTCGDTPNTWQHPCMVVTDRWALSQGATHQLDLWVDGGSGHDELVRACMSEYSIVTAVIENPARDLPVGAAVTVFERWQASQGTATAPLPVPPAPAPTPVEVTPLPTPGTAAPLPGALPGGPAWSWAPVPAHRTSGQLFYVKTAADLTAALQGAKSGDAVLLAPGTYRGRFVLRTPDVELYGTGGKPTDVVLDGGSMSSGYGLQLDGAHRARVVNLSVTGSEKGVMVDGSAGVVGSHLDVGRLGAEGIHWRNVSAADWTYCHVHDTGLTKPEYGEGWYPGTAKSNLAAATSRTGGKGDATTGSVRYCSSAAITAESVDLKESTTGLVVEYNRFEQPLGNKGAVANFADSAIDVKSNKSTIRFNEFIGKGCAVNAVQVHGNVVDGILWGCDNVITDNYGSTAAPGVSVDTKVTGNRIERNW